MSAASSAGSATGAVVRLGILGCGNMGGAFARGVLAHASLQTVVSLITYDPGEKAMQAMRDIGARTADSPLELARMADIILLAVKPQYVGEVLSEISPALSESAGENGGNAKTVLSIAAGVPLQQLRDGVNGLCPVVRVMPNILVEVSQGLFALCFDKVGRSISEAHRGAVRELLSGLGQIVELEEGAINAFTALAGSGPAYVYHFMDSLAEAGVSVGISRESADAIALGLVRGAAALAETAGVHPVLLREQVSSPGGTTIAGLNHLDRTGVRGHLIDAVIAAYQRAECMDKER